MWCSFKMSNFVEIVNRVNKCVTTAQKGLNKGKKNKRQDANCNKITKILKKY